MRNRIDGLADRTYSRGMSNRLQPSDALDLSGQRRPQIPVELRGPRGRQSQGVADRGDALRGNITAHGPVVDHRAPASQPTGQLSLRDIVLGEKRDKRRCVHTEWTTTGPRGCPRHLDDISRYVDPMPETSLRDTMTGLLRARRHARGLSLEQVGVRAGTRRTNVHAIETGVSGDYLDRLESIAAALHARWEVELVPTDASSAGAKLRRLSAALPEAAAAELLTVVRAWGALSKDDRELVTHLAARCLARQAEQDVPPRLDRPNQGKRVG